MSGSTFFYEIPAGASIRRTLMRLSLLTALLLSITILSAVETVDAGSVADDTAIAFVAADTVAVRDRVPIADPLEGGPLDILFVGRHDRVGGVIGEGGLQNGAVIAFAFKWMFQAQGVPDFMQQGLPGGAAAGGRSAVLRNTMVQVDPGVGAVGLELFAYIRVPGLGAADS